VPANKALVNNLTIGIAILKQQLKVCKNVSEITRLELEVKELQQRLDGEINGMVKSESV
tara:strand:+ start:777 stop:953 length:177 start_codon:yes stop_codon:yes gene_type:complete